MRDSRIGCSAPRTRRSSWCSGLAVWAKRRGGANASWVNVASWGIGAVAIVGAVLSVIYVIRIGHSGTEAVWSDLPG